MNKDKVGKLQCHIYKNLLNKRNTPTIVQRSCIHNLILMVLKKHALEQGLFYRANLYTRAPIIFTINLCNVQIKEFKLWIVTQVCLEINGFELKSGLYHSNTQKTKNMTGNMIMLCWSLNNKSITSMEGILSQFTTMNKYLTFSSFTLKETKTIFSTSSNKINKIKNVKYLILQNARNQ